MSSVKTTRRTPGVSGTFSLEEGLATVTVDMIRGEVQNPLEIIGNIVESARKSGARSVRIRGTLAYEKFYES